MTKMTQATDPLSDHVGDELRSFARVGDLEAWNRYAAVNDEFVPIHMDHAAGRAAGFPGAIGMGNLQWAYLHNVVRAWLGDRGRIVRISCRFTAPWVNGATLTAGGRILASHEDAEERTLDLEIWASDDEGTVTAHGSATVRCHAAGPVGPGDAR
jgi:acyl dehydratase